MQSSFAVKQLADCLMGANAPVLLLYLVSGGAHTLVARGGGRPGGVGLEVVLCSTFAACEDG